MQKKEHMGTGKTKGLQSELINSTLARQVRRMRSGQEAVSFIKGAMRIETPSAKDEN